MGKFLSSVSSVISLEPKRAHMDLAAWRSQMVKGDTTTSFFSLNNSFTSTFISEEDLILLYENRNFNADLWQEYVDDDSDTVSVLRTPILAQEEVLRITFPSQEFAEIVNLDDDDSSTVWTRMWSRLKRLVRCLAK